MPLRESFPNAGEAYLDVVSEDGWEYRIAFAGSRLADSFDMVRHFLHEEGYGDIPLPASAADLRLFRRHRQPQMLLFNDIWIRGRLHHRAAVLDQALCAVQRLQRHRHRFRRATWARLARKFSLAVLGAQHWRILATLAHVSGLVVPRLCVHAGSVVDPQPCAGRACLDAGTRAMARVFAALPALGRLPWPWLGGVQVVLHSRRPCCRGTIGTTPECMARSCHPIDTAFCAVQLCRNQCHRTSLAGEIAMYEWLCSKFPLSLVRFAYAVWYAGIMVLVLLLADKPAADFYYLHG